MTFVPGRFCRFKNVLCSSTPWYRLAALTMGRQSIRLCCFCAAWHGGTRMMNWRGSAINNYAIGGDSNGNIVQGMSNHDDLAASTKLICLNKASLQKQEMSLRNERQIASDLGQRLMSGLNRNSAPSCESTALASPTDTSGILTIRPSLPSMPIESSGLRFSNRGLR